jgi:hypothetical protein
MLKYRLTRSPTKLSFVILEVQKSWYVEWSAIQIITVNFAFYLQNSKFHVKIRLLAKQTYHTSAQDTTVHQSSFLVQQNTQHLSIFGQLVAFWPNYFLVRLDVFVNFKFGRKRKIQ